ncbi:hypothetical protein WS61_07710 [Burkholderia sp. ABCPW 11]|nr:hypothetical protein WS61_07710 [Burkholderia sp. ABCPW 11]
MITINTEKQLIRVDDWSTIVERAGFTNNLDPKQHELKEIIGRYVFKDKLRCGLSSCHTPHNRGFIVVTKSGLETNIGKDCGKTHFGVDFNDKSRQFERDITEKENRETLWSFHFRLDELMQTIEEIRKGERGADWVYRHTRPLVELNKGVPEKIVRYVCDMVKRGSSIVTVPRQATKEEADAEEARIGRHVPRPFIIDEPVGQVSNLDALYRENDLREILVLDLEMKCKELSELDVDTLTYDQLTKWVKWVGTVEAKLQRARDAVASGRQLLTVANLSCLGEVSSADAWEFEQYLKPLN